MSPTGSKTPTIPKLSLEKDRPVTRKQAVGPDPATGSIPITLSGGRNSGPDAGILSFSRTSDLQPIARVVRRDLVQIVHPGSGMP